MYAFDINQLANVDYQIFHLGRFTITKCRSERFVHFVLGRKKLARWGCALSLWSRRICAGNIFFDRQLGKCDFDAGDGFGWWKWVGLNY